MRRSHAHIKGQMSDWLAVRALVRPPKRRSRAQPETMAAAPEAAPAAETTLPAYMQGVDPQALTTPLMKQ